MTSLDLPYSPDHCQTVLDCGARGMSLAEMAAELGVGRMQLEAWAQAHSDFAQALTLAQDRALAVWEGRVREQMIEGVDHKVNASLYLRLMAARFPQAYDRPTAEGEEEEEPEVIILGSGPHATAP